MAERTLLRPLELWKRMAGNLNTLYFSHMLLYQLQHHLSFMYDHYHRPRGGGGLTYKFG